MAINFGASGRILKRTTGLPTTAAFTVAARIRVRSLLAQYSYFYALEDAASNATAWAVLGYASDNRFNLSNPNAPADYPPVAPVIGQWTFAAMTLSGAGAGNHRSYTAPIGATALNAYSAAGVSFTPGMLALGNDSYDEYSDVDIANAMIWGAVLTEYELIQQMHSARPVRWKDLYLWSPLRTIADVNDYSGNNNHWTIGGSPVGVENPPLDWRRQLWMVPLVVASGGTPISGDGAATIGAISAAGSGTLGAAPVTGTGAATLGSLTAAGSGSASANGAGAATLGALAAAAAGSAAIVGTGAATIGALTAAGQAYVLLGACIGGVLTVDPTNPRYFRNDSGIVVLAGFHHWNEFYDAGASYPPTAQDYIAWLDYVDARGANFHKLWLPETARQWADVDQYFLPLPYARTGPGNAADGRPKFDLTQFNQDYFDRLRERVILAGNRGHYVIVKFFEGWQIDIHGYYYYPFDYHWFNAANNINGIDGDTDDDRNGEETRDLANTAIIAYQQAYIEKIIDTLNDLDNVLWEISNEDVSTSQAWQYHWIDHIHTYEAGKAKQHPVGMSSTFHAVGDSELYASNADWIAGSAAFPANMTAVDGTKVYLYDTDHVMGLTDVHLWIWRAVCRGYNPVYMDQWDGTLYGLDTRTDATYERIRYNLGAVLDYVARLDIAHMTPQNSLADTGYCLAKTTGAHQFLVYQDYSGSFQLNLTSYAGTYSVEWLRTNATTPTTQAGSNVSGGAVRTLTPPWAGEDVVALLELVGYSGTGAATIGGLTAVGAASARIDGASAATIGAVAVVAVGVVAVTGASQAAVGALVAAAAGSVAVNGTGAAVVGTVEAASAGSVAVDGDAAATIGALAAAGAGVTSSESVSGSGAAVIGDIVAAGVGSASVNGAAAALVGAIAAGSVVAITVNGAGAADLGTFEASGFGGSGAGGAALATIGDIVAAGAGSASINGAALATIGDVMAAGAGTVPVSGVGLATVGALVAAGTASVAVAADGSAVIGAIVAAGSGALTDLPPVYGAAAVTIGAITAGGTGVVAWVLAIARIAGPGVPGVVSGPKSSIGE